MIPFRMDPVTHALAGATIKQLGFKKKAALAVLVISSLAPDIDYITRFWGMDIFLRYHRGLTHGILALFVIPALIGLMPGLRKNFFYYTGISFLGYGLHLLMDLTNQYGTRILSPLDWEQYSLDATFIIEPYITIGLIIAVVMGRLNRKRASLIAAVALLLLFVFVGSKLVLHNKALDFLKARLDANTYKMSPLPNDFLRWWFVVRSGDEFIVGFVDLFSERVCIHERYRQDSSNLLIKKSIEERAVKNFLYFAKYPYASVRTEGENSVVVWRELAYSFRAGEHFVTKVVYDKNGRALKSEFRF